MQKRDEHTRKIGTLVAKTIVSEEFWEEVENIIKIMKSLFFLIKFYDGDSPKMGEIYEKMDTILGEIRDIMKENKHI